MASSSTQPTTIADPFYKALEELITDSDPSGLIPREVLLKLGTPSHSIAILDDGHLTSHMISTDPKHNPDTLFQACSISKPCAGLGIARLIDQGVFGLDDLVCNLLPAKIIEMMTADARTAAAMRSITVRMLMSHTAGLSVHGCPGYRVEEKHPRWSPAEIIAGGRGINTVPIRVVAPPGLGFMYSGGGMTVLQAIVEHTTGKPFAVVQRELVLEPLGMTRSFYTLPWVEGEEGGNVAEPYWTGVTKCETRWHVLPEEAAGGLWTTPTDLLRMARAMQQSLVDGSFISKDLARQIVTEVKDLMGLTWFAQENSFGHAGSNNPGYRCMMYGYEDLPWNGEKARHKREKNGMESNVEEAPAPKGCAISIMTNSAEGADVLWKVIRAIAYLKGWPLGGEFMSPIEVGAPLAVQGDIETGKSTEWKRWMGRWTDRDELITLKIAENEDGKPVVSVVDDATGDTVMVSLRTAAVPSIRYLGGRESVELVLDGMEVSLRLGWEKEKKKEEAEAEMVVELMRHLIVTRTVLYKTE